MNVVVTIVLLVFAALWGMATYTRLVSLRRKVKDEWARARKIDPSDPALESAKKQYNAMAGSYNDALRSFPANLVAAIAGFKRAENL